MIRILKILFVLLVMVMLTSCPSGKDDPNDPNSTGTPTAAKLVFPDNNLECNQGTIVNDSQSSVVFQWEASSNTNSYDLSLRNLETNSTATTSSNTNEASITIDRGVPYEWFVVSKSDGTQATAKSDTWRFYNAGGGIANYAPFPAEAVAPTRGQTINTTNSVTLRWEGNDVDNDIKEYEVRFGTDVNTTTTLGTTTQNAINANVSSGITYYWRVITIDDFGNTSQSEVFNFKVQ